MCMQPEKERPLIVSLLIPAGAGRVFFSFNYSFVYNSWVNLFWFLLSVYTFLDYGEMIVFNYNFGAVYVVWSVLKLQISSTLF